MALLLEPVASLMSSALKGLAILVFLCVTFLAVQTAYNLWFHPLRKIPGPPLARVSRLWARIGNFHGRKSERIHAAHEQYGPVVRVGPNEISFANPDAVHEIYTSSSFVKEETFYRAKRMFTENHMFAFRDPEAHKQRRKMLARGFSQAAMLDFESNLSTKIQALLSQWQLRTKDRTPIDIYSWCHWLGFDTVYHLMFDEDPGSVTAGQPHEVMRYISAWRPTFIWKEFIPQLETWGPSVPGPLGDMFRLVRTWKVLAMNIIRGCRLKDTKTPFLRSALNDVDPALGRPLTDSELAEECMGGMFGGSGTTANTFLFLVWAVSRDARIQSKLRQELVEAFPDPIAVPDYTTCSKLPYLSAVIDETLRRYPTIVATLPRTAKEEVMIQGVHVPQGTIVGTQNYTIHRDRDAFPQPEVFSPERWLDDDKDMQQLRKKAFTAFGVGSRKCIGINLAQLELWKLVAAFFRRFECSIDSSITEEQMRMYDNFSARPAGGRLVVHLTDLALPN
ncbi:hypothetical protein H2200_000262 [Cladophialophora chaetospira]|uniref:Cytochrome P450 n=1 Tax=Cladophialophora chaetospira TaxID=386627 RepID=A0AA38XN31_9EURO|nr:hypothetical protein H2200_000262 [Cladophialophora chaetospira]